MRPFKDQPIAKKAITLSVVPTICALVVAIVASLASTFFQARDNLMQDLDAQAGILADNAGAALAFRDRSAAENTLLVLRAKTNVDAACLYDSDGALFASYGKSQDSCSAEK